MWNKSHINRKGNPFNYTIYPNSKSNQLVRGSSLTNWRYELSKSETPPFYLCLALDYKAVETAKSAGVNSIECGINPTSIEKAILLIILFTPILNQTNW